MPTLDGGFEKAPSTVVTSMKGADDEAFEELADEEEVAVVVEVSDCDGVS